MAFESRMDKTVRHRLLGDSASCHRILETQASLLARSSDGRDAGVSAVSGRVMAASCGTGMLSAI